MDEFRRGLLLQMGENRSRTRSRREPWLYAAVALPLAAVLLYFLEARLLAAGVLLGGCGFTLFRLSRLRGSERDRLLGQLLVLIGLAASAFGLWRLR